jgi:hypothetical protein
VGLFNKGNKPAPAPIVNGPDFTIQTVRDHLEEIGNFRQKIRGAAMKVALSVIAWNGEAYLMRQNPSGQPSGVDIVNLCNYLETVRRVMVQYQQVEARLDFASDSTQEVLYHGLTSVKGFADRMVSSVTTGGDASLTGYIVDTQILSM